MPLRSFEVDPTEAGERLDRLAARRLETSRSIIQRIIQEGLLFVDGEAAVPSYRVRGGERVEARIPGEGLAPEEIPILVVFEDDFLVVVDKPAGLVVHPGAGNPSGTLANALLGRGIAGGEDPVRPGIVHRLDRDTSGLMVLVGEGLPETGTVDSPVGRDPDNPTLMTAGVGRPAVTHFEVLREVAAHSMLGVRLETGRTHQIRVHLAAIGHPVYADPLYGTPVSGRRLWLHAENLAFVHPQTGEDLRFESPIPEDLREAALALDASLALW
jgi:23S rRNA pseudouridine1911/1915/1917 synthase